LFYVDKRILRPLPRKKVVDELKPNKSIDEKDETID